jgi:hypothetical protein
VVGGGVEAVHVPDVGNVQRGERLRLGPLHTLVDAGQPDALVAQDGVGQSRTLIQPPCLQGDEDAISALLCVL